MNKDIVELQEDVSKSELYSPDLAPVSSEKRTWSKWHLAAIWVGMAVCIPTYLLASYMIKTGLNWYEALIIIGVANLIITIPMVLNGHAGVKYGIPFPVIGRAVFGIKGVHIASVTRGIIACGWFGVQTWIGGLAIYAIFNAVTSTEGELGLSIGKFVGFAIFWCINIYFIWKGTESIKWLEAYSAPILIIMGLALIGWGYTQANGFSIVLQQSEQLEKPAASILQENNGYYLQLNALKDREGVSKANEFKVFWNTGESDWKQIPNGKLTLSSFGISGEKLLTEEGTLKVQYRNTVTENTVYSSVVSAKLQSLETTRTG